MTFKALSLVAISLITVNVASAQTEYIPGRILVTFIKPQNENTASAKIKKYGKLSSIKKLRLLSDGAAAIADIAKGKEKSAVASLKKFRGSSSEIEAAELDMKIAPDFTPNDPSFPNQWHLPKISAPQAWDSVQGSPGIIVAILDSGVDANHPELQNKIVPGWNAYNNNSDTTDVYGHGTKVAGSAVAASNNGSGIASLCWNCGIMPIRVTDTSGYAYYSALASGLDWARSKGARVANMSFAAFNSTTVLSVTKSFQQAGGVVTISAGNGGNNSTLTTDSSVVVVSATTSSDQKASWSTYGKPVTVAAPGENILTTANGGGYGIVSGTSFAAPITAGVAALVLSAKPTLSGLQARQVIIDSADDLAAAGWDEQFGYGRINAAKAVALALGTISDTIPPQISFTSPSAGTSLTNAVSITANATDNAQVASVSFYINGKLIATDTTAPYAASWNTLNYANGIYSLVAVAQDTSSNQNSSEISVNVSNILDTVSPTAQLTSPTDGARLSKNVTVSGIYRDNIAVSRVELYVDGTLSATSIASPFSIKLNSAKLARGTHTIRTVAYDAAGNSSSSQTVTVTK